MSDLFSVVEISRTDADKIQHHLNKIKQTQAVSSDAIEAVNSASVEFTKFFSNYGQPYFSAHKLRLNDTPRSSLYNENLNTLNDDISRAYVSLESANNSTINAFNFASIVSDEIKNTADLAASKVLDLNILNGYTKGQVIIAGDDFADNSKLDISAAVGSSQADQLLGSKAYGLSVIDSKTISNENIKVSVFPLKPVSSSGGTVNTSPTPFNLQRFYEGKFYAFIGQQDPEGGQLQFKYTVSPSVLPEKVSETYVNGVKVGQSNSSAPGSQDNLSIADAKNTPNFFAVVPASEELKNNIRLKMFDNNPDTYWQCEYVYETEPLIDPYASSSEDFEKFRAEGKDTDLAPVLEGSQVTIDLKAAEELAQKYDYTGRDLEIIMDIDLGSITPINYILINPIVAGTSSFVKILDLATADGSSDFSTVDGFDSQSFDKVLTPEANKFLDKETQAKSMAPSAFSYGGLGVFSFPVRFASKVRIRMSAEEPVPAPYERMHILVQEETKLTTVNKSKKKGLF